jgi:hypothetical protein
MEINKSALVSNVMPVSSSDEVERASMNEKFEGGLDALAKHANHTEHNLGPAQAVKEYAPAIFWSVMVSMCVVMVRTPSISLILLH